MGISPRKPMNDGCVEFGIARMIIGLSTFALPWLTAGSLAAQSLPRGVPAIGDPLPGLTAEQSERFRLGKEAFTFELADEHGVGPVFNGRSCAGCHASPAPGGGAELFGIRFGRATRHGFDDLQSLGGPTIQAFGIGQAGDVDFVGETVPAEANVVARRRATPTFGFGLVDTIPDDTLIRLANRQRQKNPATAGRPNLVVDLRTGLPAVGKFGWKATSANLFDFAADAYKDELGVTTAGFTDPDEPGIILPFARSADGRSVSEENPPQGDASLLAANPVASPNQTNDENVRKFSDFMTFLAAPTRGQITLAVTRGEALFEKIGCAECHTPTQTTGQSSIRALNQVTFRPYSDFLLHDMGTLGDGIVSAGPVVPARGSEMRTAPLWGLRFQKVYLHDGRAGSIDGAIRWHDGQGAASRARYLQLPSASRRDLEAFLKSL